MTSSAPPPPKLTLTLRELVVRRATGVLTVRSGDASGEVRVRDGVIEDVVLGRAEGKKALARMLADDRASLAFREGDGEWLARTFGTVDELFAEAHATRERIRAAMERFADRLEAAVVATELSDAMRGSLSAGAKALWSRLRVPVSFMDVLDLTPAEDADVLAHLTELDERSALRWLWPQSERQPLLTALWDRARVAERLAPKARLVFAGTPDRLAVFAHSLSFVEDVVRAPEPAPLVPMPYVLARTTVDLATVEIALCPLVPVYSPFWPIALANAALVIRLDEAAPELLEAAAELSRVRVVQAEALVGPLDEARVGAVVALVRAALDDAAM